MAEKIVSPGVFTLEKDLSFVPQGVSEIGAAIIGPTEKGPAFVPTLISNYGEFERIFGTDTDVSYVPYTVKEYLQSAGTVTIVRVLDVGGYSLTPLGIQLSDSGNAAAASSGSLTLRSISGSDFFITGSGGTIYKFVGTTDVGAIDEDSDTTKLFFISGADISHAALSASFENFINELNENSTTMGINFQTSSAAGQFTVHMTASTAGTGGNSLGIKMSATASQVDTLEGGTAAGAGARLVSVIHPGNNANDATGNFDASTFGTSTSTSTLFRLSGSADTSGTDVTASFNTTDNTYIENIFDDTPKSAKTGYLLVNFREYQSSSYATATSVSYVTSSIDYGNGGTDTSPAYKQAATPMITSQFIDGTNTTDLFQVKTRAHGDSTNRSYKISITDVKFASEVPNSDYGTFTLSVRDFNDTDKNPVVLESFAGLTLNKMSPNFVSRVIGDQNITVDGDGKITVSGDYPNRSQYIYIAPATGLNEGGLAKPLVPFGFAKVKEPTPSAFGTCPTASLKTTQVDSNGNYQTYVHYGFDFDNILTANDNINYVNPIDKNAGNGNNVIFNLAANFSHISHSTAASLSLSGSTSPLNARKFSVPFQEGFNGMNPGVKKNAGGDITAGNTFGFNLTSATSTGAKSYKKALKAISNQDEFDINMIVTPGVVSRIHSSTAQQAIDIAEQRSDCFYIMDAGAKTDSIATITGEVENYDTSYAATYYPWVKIRDAATNQFKFVPPSVVLPGVYSFNDKVAHEWFAPAGLNRGGLSTVTDVYNRLTHADRDELYDGRVNPIASFPGQGVTVFGQKTLQVKASALDRVNVRRLLINLKKFIASTARFLVFENNTTATRNRFLSTVNPYLESVQQNQGLFAFRVVMDETNNTPDMIDRNIMKGEIFIQPAKAAEFIVVDFNILPTGASFND